MRSLNNKLKFTLVCQLAITGLFGGNAATAGVISTSSFLAPTSVNAGDTATLALTLSLTPSAGSYSDALDDITINLDSGDGQVFSQTFLSVGGTSFSFSHDFTYSNSGDFAPSLSGSATDIAWFNNYVTVQTGYQTYSYVCGYNYYWWWSYPTYCQGGYPTYSTYNYPYSTEYTSNLTGSADIAVLADPVKARITSSSVPEPATFALLGLGLAGLGYTRRRKA